MSRRSDFLAANRGVRAPMPGFVLLVRDRADGDTAMRFGITVTKKIGGAVVRNRIKRRFRVLVREILPAHGIAGADHVLIGRSDGIERDFSLLRAELEKALGKVIRRARENPSDSRDSHRPRSNAQRTRGKGSGQKAPTQSSKA